MKTQLFLTIISVILLAASVSQAAMVYFDTADPFVMPGETISISIFSTVITFQIRMDRISNADSGTASNLHLNPEYFDIINEGTLVNTGGILIEDILTMSPPVSPQVSGVLYSFDYTLSEEVMYGEIINIFPDSSDGAINYVRCDTGYGVENIIPESLSLTVVPEPVTIVLLAMGSLLLTRKTGASHNSKLF
jgi:hypothetical protein